MALKVKSLRRYPVKSMGGEALKCAEVDARGIVGDRWFAVEDAAGQFASGKNTRRFRRRDQVFDYEASSGGDGVHVRGRGQDWLVGNPALDRHLSARMGMAVQVKPEGVVPHQDKGAVSLIGTATLQWCAERWKINADPRRLRVNIVVETEEPFIEDQWLGDAELSLGSVGFRGAQRIPRCRMIDINQDGAISSGLWLKPLAAERDMLVGIYIDVVRPGLMALEDRVLVS